jgi:ribosomal protein S12 methylthiotransferase accessory factor YcaO
MRRYMVFAWDAYYPSGGMHDFVNSYSDLEHARKTLTEALTETEEQSAKDYGHIYDSAKERNIVTGVRVWTPEKFYYVVTVKDA